LAGSNGVQDAALAGGVADAIADCDRCGKQSNTQDGADR